MLNKIGQRVKDRREMLSYTQADLAKMMGYHGKSAISKIENNEVSISIDKLIYLADILQTTTSYLLGLINDPELPEEKALQQLKHSNDMNNIPFITSVPVLGEVAAGSGSFAENHVIKYESIPSNWINTNEQYILLKVSGDSMEPLFVEGDLLLIKPQDDCDNGDYAIVLIDGENGVVKRFHRENDYIELISINPYYPPRKFVAAEMNRLRIFGVVKKCIRDF